METLSQRLTDSAAGLNSKMDGLIQTTEHFNTDNVTNVQGRLIEPEPLREMHWFCYYLVGWTVGKKGPVSRK